MSWFWTVLSALAAIAKAVLAGLAFKKAQEEQADAAHDENALQRHEANGRAIDDAFGGVRDAKAAGGGPSATPPAPPAV